MDSLGNDDETSPKTKLNKRKLIRIMVLLACIILTISLVFLYKKNDSVRDFFDKYIFRKMINEENVPYIEIDNSKGINVIAFDKYICVLEQNVFKFYDRLGKEESKLDIEISNPIYEINGNYLCIAEKDGQKVYLIKITQRFQLYIIAFKR